MKANRLAALALPIALVAGCAAKREAAPAPIQAPPLRPVAVAPAPAPVGDWRDAPITPGDWRYIIALQTSTNGGPSQPPTIAVFGLGRSPEKLALSCEAGKVELGVGELGERAVPVTITTTSEKRTFTTVPGANGRHAIALSPNDAFLDAVAFTRGRFAVEPPGLPAIYAPAASEIARVIEDCR